ncbi:DNA replication complex GINS family protein [Desulfurococcaceae archaeon MEX13E-LK6-19]|nr:DNA replication complex GINS family protein [Desulfurococcaceae archaeon MEX13E-LK6-19]
MVSIVEGQENLVSRLMNIGLRILFREYEEEYVRAIIVEDIGKIFLPEGVVELVKGSEYSIPRWVARELARRGLVEVKDDGIGLERLAKITYGEETTTRRMAFEKLHPYFYHMVKDEIESLYRVLEEEKKPMILADINRYEEYLSKIGRIRVRKLINLLLIKPPQDLMNKLSEEEVMLYRMLKDLLMKWLISLRIEKGT